MANELVKAQPMRAPALPSLEPKNLNDARALCAIMVEAQAFKGTVDANQALAKVLVGRAMGLHFAEALRDVHIYNGQITLSYVQIGKKLRQAGYDYRVTERTEEKCTIEFYRSGEELGPPVTYTIEQAKAAGKAKPPKPGKEPGPWLTDPETMLLKTALTRGARWYCPDALGMTVYEQSEIGDAAIDADYEVIGEDDSSFAESYQQEQAERAARSAERKQAGLSALKEVVNGNGDKAEPKYEPDPEPDPEPKAEQPKKPKNGRRKKKADKDTEKAEPPAEEAPPVSAEQVAEIRALVHEALDGNKKEWESLMEKKIGRVCKTTELSAYEATELIIELKQKADTKGGSPF